MNRHSASLRNALAPARLVPRLIAVLVLSIASLDGSVVGLGCAFDADRLR